MSESEKQREGAEPTDKTNRPEDSERPTVSAASPFASSVAALSAFLTSPSVLGFFSAPVRATDRLPA